MAKIAVPTVRVLARGQGWIVEDVICTSGPRDRPFDERHSLVRIAIVVAGSFQYRSTTGRALMTPGSLLLGNEGHHFECGHEHSAGDRCLSFGFAPELFERVAIGAGLRRLRFDLVRVPAVRDLSAVVSRACAALAASTDVSWEEIGVRLAGQVIRFANHAPPRSAAPQHKRDVARVAQTVHSIEHEPYGDLSLVALARGAGLSPYHFLRTFERLTGVTPHQYVVRTRLRAAATRLASERGKIIDIALDSGFGDVSNFNRAFRAEFGVSPRAYRRQVV